MASEGPNSPGTLASDSSYGDTAWADPANAASSDNVYATLEGTGLGMSSEYLKVTNFGFSIPAGATIDGIVVSVERNGTQNITSILDDRVRIVKGGTVGSTDKADMATSWPTSDATATYGTSSDLWGETWTVADINGSTFGMAISTTEDLSETASVDHITITVTYTAAISGGSRKLLMGVGS